MRKLEVTDIPGVVVFLLAMGLAGGFKAVFVAIAALVISYIYFLQTTPAPQSPPPPAPEPKIFGRDQATAAKDITKVPEEAAKIVTFLVKVLGYENRVNEQVSQKISDLHTEIKSREDSIEYNLQQIARLQQANGNAQKSIANAKDDINSETDTAVLFGGK